jgi:hypothetical protein
MTTREQLKKLRAGHPYRVFRSRFDDTYGTVIEWRGKTAGKGAKWHRVDANDTRAAAFNNSWRMLNS